MDPWIWFFFFNLSRGAWRLAVRMPSHLSSYVMMVIRFSESLSVAFVWWTKFCNFIVCVLCVFVGFWLSIKWCCNKIILIMNQKISQFERERKVGTSCLQNVTTRNSRMRSVFWKNSSTCLISSSISFSMDFHHNSSLLPLSMYSNINVLRRKPCPVLFSFLLYVLIDSRISWLVNSLHN